MPKSRHTFVCVTLLLICFSRPGDSTHLFDDKDDDPIAGGNPATATSTFAQQATAQLPVPILLWPDASNIPGERPGTIGNEAIACTPPATATNPNCTDMHINNVTNPALYPYLVQDSDTAVIVAPGGGYGVLAFDREGLDIAVWLNSIGISAFVLKYRVPGRHWLPFGAAPLMDAQRAMGLVRSYATASTDNILPNLNASKIGFIGFSAGAHLTGHLNVAWEHRSYDTNTLDDPIDKVSCRPDFAMMIYPWRSVPQPPVNEPVSGASSMNVTNTTPPTLLVQTEDDWALVENSIYYFLALKQTKAAAGLASELHVYPHGGHGYGRCNSPGFDTHYEVCTWPDRAKAFLTTLGILKKEKTAEMEVIEVAAPLLARINR